MTREKVSRIKKNEEKEAISYRILHPGMVSRHMSRLIRDQQNFCGRDGWFLGLKRVSMMNERYDHVNVKKRIPVDSLSFIVSVFNLICMVVCKYTARLSGSLRCLGCCQTKAEVVNFRGAVTVT